MSGYTKVLQRLANGRLWYKGGAGSGDKRCLMAACAEVSASTYEYRQIIDPLEEVICEQFADRACGTLRAQIAAFNDHPDTTWDDVCLVIEKAEAKEAESV